MHFERFAPNATFREDLDKTVPGNNDRQKFWLKQDIAVDKFQFSKNKQYVVI